MNLSMWWKALRIIPRIDKAEWERWMSFPAG